MQPTVSLHGNESKIVDHPEVGPITLDCDVLSVHGTDLRLVILTAQPGSEAADKLGLLSVLGNRGREERHTLRALSPNWTSTP